MNEQPPGADPMVLVTGASGFAGRHLVRHLNRAGYTNIIGTSSQPRPPLDGGRLLVCDLRDFDLTRRMLDQHRPALIFHLAGQAYVPQSFASPVETLTINAVGQLNLFEACLATSLDPVIVVAGSSDVYGVVSEHDLPLSEDQPFRPVNPYAVSKAAQDLYAWQYWASHRFSVVRARPFNHIGPGQSDRFVVSSFARQIAEAEAERSEPVLLVGNLAARRDFLDVRDVVRAYVMLARDEFAGEAFNIASGVAVSIEDVLQRLIDLAQCEITVRVDEQRFRPVDVPEIRGDARRISEATGWTPHISLETSLRDVLEDWRMRVR